MNRHLFRDLEILAERSRRRQENPDYDHYQALQEIIADLEAFIAAYKLPDHDPDKEGNP